MTNSRVGCPLAFLATALGRVALAAAVLTLLGPAAIAQNTPDDLAGIRQGSPNDISDIDAVNLGTGSLTLHIPLLSYPQRGALKVDYQILYNSQITQQQTSCDERQGTCNPPQYVLSQLPRGVYANDVDAAGASSKLFRFIWPNVSTYNYSVYLRTVKEADGATHVLGNMGTNTMPPSGGQITESGPWRAVDGTGWELLANGTLLNSQGVRPGSLDPNGNQITGNITGLTDTLGRQIPAVPNASTPSNTDFSGCTGPLAITSAVLWSPPGVNGGTTNYKFCFATVQVFAKAYEGFNGATLPQPMLQSIVLPNGTTWTFEYSDRNSGDASNVNYGNLTKITLPSGGTVSYTYADGSMFSWAQNCGIQQFDTTTVTRWVASKTVTDQTGAHTWTYGGGEVLAPDGSYVVHGFIIDYQGTPHETATSYYNAAGTLLKSTAITYNTPVTTCFQGVVNYLPLARTTTLDNGQVTKETYTYDSGFAFKDIVGRSATANYGKVTSATLQDYGNGAPGSVIRYTNTSYVWQSPNPNYASYLANNLLDLPYSVQVKDGGNIQRVYTTYGYDETALQSSGITTQHVAGESHPGNQTSVHRWLNTGTLTCPGGGSGGSNSYVISNVTYFDTGKVSAATDPCGNATSYLYSSTYAGAFPTTVTNALNQATTNVFDFNTGLLTSTTDPNQLMTSYSYDSMWRLSQVNHPDGGVETITHQETSQPFTATLTTPINSTQNKVQTNLFDVLGRVTQSQVTSDPQGAILTDTTYDSLGRVATVSNPHRSGTDPTSSPGTTTYAYDALGRKITETYPDSSVLTTAYCGPSTLVTDPAGKWRRSRTDALGRLVEVDEPNAIGATVASTGCPGTGEPIWVTSYTNDVLGNLTQAVQNGSHTRTFTYDSFSRLLTSANPETGTITYTYNPDGPVLTKADARAITTAYTYDALHRTKALSYSNSDPSLAYNYDETNCLGLTACQNIGHRTSMTDGAGSEIWAYQVDATNHRSIHKEQRTNNSSPSNITKSTTYYMNLAGGVTQLVYPTGRTVNYTYDSADRPSTAADSANGVTYATDWQTPPSGCLASAACYTPQGSLYAVSLGKTSSFAGINVSESFNNRLQPNEIKATAPYGNLLDLTYNFVDPTSGKNAGHAYGVTNVLNSSRSQSFTYDQLNRITSAGTSATTGTYCWGYQYSYDPYGNLLSQAAWTPNYNGCSETTMGGVTADGSNHISGLSYDASGNTLSDGNYTYTWNGESQIKTAGGVAYSYDGDGRRAAKVGSKLYWYGSGGEILSETDAAGNIQNEYVFFGGKRVALVAANGDKRYYVEDSLGSSRVFAGTGSICYDGDFTPFGGERAYTSTCVAQNYKFEGKERDTETQNDDFGAREYSWRFGRWLSSDWSAVPVAVPYANLTNPQTLNLYAMVADDPESFADLDGHEAASPDQKQETTVAQLEEPEREEETPQAEAERALEPVEPEPPVGETPEPAYQQVLDQHSEKDVEAVKNGACSVDPKLEPAIREKAEMDKIADPLGSTKTGEPPQLARGKAAHNTEEVRPGEQKEVRTPSGKRMDRYNNGTAHIREIKPNNARGVKAGQRQLNGYKTEMDKSTGRSHTTELTTYDQ